MGWEPNCSKVLDVLRLDSEPSQSELPCTTSLTRMKPLHFFIRHEEHGDRKRRIQSSFLGSRVEVITVFAPDRPPLAKCPAIPAHLVPHRQQRQSHDVPGSATPTEARLLFVPAQRALQELDLRKVPSTHAAQRLRLEL